MSRLSGRSATVVGAGPAGLAAAAFLARRGARVDVRERAGALAPVGAGLQLSPNGLAVLDALGVDVPAVEARALELRDGVTGRRILEMGLDGRRWRRGFRFARRADLVGALAGAARSAGARIHLGSPAGAGADPGADIVVAADGIDSAARAALDGEGGAVFSGHVAWRAVIADGAGADRNVRVHLGPGRHLVTYPLDGGKRNLVAVEERGAWDGETRDRADDPANLRAAFRGFAREARDWLEAVDGVRLWGLFLRPVARRWQDGRRVLAGDAAHPTLPFMAQGANLALEDAFVLAECLDAAPREEALARYEALRRPRALRAVRAAAANGRRYHLAGPPARAAHAGLRLAGRLAPELVRARFDWLYGEDVTR